MKFRTKLIAAFLSAVLAPIVVLALFVRSEMTDRLTTQYEQRVESFVRMIADDLLDVDNEIAIALDALKESLVDDNRFRRAAVDGVQVDRQYLLDYAGSSMRLSGLSMLQVQDEAGRIISSGHFRNEFDRLESDLPRILAAIRMGGENGARITLVSARSADGPFVAIARIDSLRMGDRSFTIVGGEKVDERFLNRLVRDTEMGLELSFPGGTITSLSPATDDSSMVSKRAIVRELNVSFVGTVGSVLGTTQEAQIGSAKFRVSHQLGGLSTLRRSLDRWFLLATASAALLVVVVSIWLGARISRPLVELAEKTSRIDLDRLNVSFRSERKDEIGTLSRLLGAMTKRLRTSAAEIKDAEHRATQGELARQVNHDVKNGLTPIRNVFRHLVDVADRAPDKLPDVFRERQETMDSSIGYLENLASNYARISPRSQRRPCDVNDVVRRVAADARGVGGRNVILNLDTGGAMVLGDPMSLRRVMENLVDNAFDSLRDQEGVQGRVSISTETMTGDSGERFVHVTIADTGSGMTKDQVDRAFDDFYTSKDSGTGLGLSIVRRLVMDLNGSVKVESEIGLGTRVEVDLPALDANVKETDSQF